MQNITPAASDSVDLSDFPGFGDMGDIIIVDDVAGKVAVEADQGFGGEDGFYDAGEVTSGFTPDPLEAHPAASRETTRASMTTNLEKIKSIDAANRAGAYKADASDPIFEATLDTFRASGFKISRDDETFAVMQFLYFAVKRIESEVSAERRVEHDDLLSHVISLRESVVELTERQGNSASIIETNLDQALAHHTRSLLNMVATVVTATERKINENIKKAEAAADGSFKERFRALVADEVRIGLAKGMDTEIQLLRSAVDTAARTLNASTKATAARARKGWIQNAVDDFSALGAQQKMAVAGGFVALLLAIVIF